MDIVHEPANGPQVLIKAFREEDPDGTRLARVFRESFDQINDGQNTGRYSISQLSKTESAHLGSIVEINIRREFDGFINDGKWMDYEIAGYEVDCKYSKMPFGWMIPMEAIGHHGMLCHANDESATFRVGFARLTDEILTKGGNRDRKRSISAAGRSSISWLHYDAPLPPNTLLQLSKETRDRVLDQKSGQKRLNELFRVAQGEIIPRGIIATVAQQKDYMKRVRSNGGSRSILRPEGIIILGDYKMHQLIAEDLDLPIPHDGDSVAVRIVPWEPTDEAPFTLIDGQPYRRATPEDPVIAAPNVPNR